MLVVGEFLFLLGKWWLFLFFFLLADYFLRGGWEVFVLKRLKWKVWALKKTGVKPGTKKTEKTNRTQRTQKNGDHLSQENNLLTIPVYWFFNRDPYNGL